MKKSARILSLLVLAALLVLPVQALAKPEEPDGQVTVLEQQEIQEIVSRMSVVDAFTEIANNLTSITGYTFDDGDGGEWMVISGNNGSSMYHVDQAGKIEGGGWITVGGQKYYLALSGKVSRGWTKIDGSWYYFAPDGRPYGAMQTGWQTIQGQVYYFASSGVMQTGWMTLDGKTYYFKDGVMQTGWQTLDGKTYYFAQDGTRQAGELQLNGNTYHLDNSGALYTGYFQTGDGWRLFSGEGLLLGSIPNTGWKKFAKGWSFMANGKWLYGWQQIDREWYFFNKQGYMQTGWKKSGNAWYYLKRSGAMARGWQKAGGKWYLLNKNTGAMTKGWQRDGGNGAGPSRWYYLGASGAMQSGWQKTGSKWYFFKRNGAMAQNEWVKSGGKWYWLADNGAMATGGTTIDGKYYIFDPSGVWVK